MRRDGLVYRTVQRISCTSEGTEGQGVSGESADGQRVGGRAACAGTKLMAQI